MRHLLAPAASLLVAVAAGAPAAIVAQYAAPGGSFAPTTVASFITASDLSETGSAGDLQPGATLPNTVFLQQNVVSPDPASAVANNQFFQFTVTPFAAYSLNLNGLTFDASRGGASTPRGWVVRSSIDAFGSDIATGTVPSQNPTLTPFSIPLTGPAFQSITAPATFRIYGFAPSTGVGMFYDNITLDGSVVEGQTIVKYTAPGGSFAPTTVAPSVTASDLGETGSAGDLQPGATLPNTVFLQQSVVSPDPASAVANGQFFQFSVTPEAGFEFDLTSLLFDVSRGGASTPRGWVVRSSLDNFAADIATGTIPTQNPNLTPVSIDLSGPEFQDIDSLLTFRVYGFAPSTGVGAFYDNIELRGTTALIVPEPSLVAIASLAAAPLRRRRRGRTGDTG